MIGPAQAADAPWMRVGASLEHMRGSVAVVLHLVSDALEEGRLAGEAELVETGARALFTSADDLVAFVTGHRASDDAPRSDGP